MPFALFNAATSNKELVVTRDNGSHEVQLPKHAKSDAVKFFLTHMNNLASEKYVREVPFTKNMELNLHLCSVADDLGMRQYTQYIFNGYYYRLQTTVPTPDDVKAIGKVNTPLGDKLFNTVGYRLAKLAWDGEHPNVTAFNTYLVTDTRLAAIVKDLYAKREAAARYQARLEEHRCQEKEADRLEKEHEKRDAAVTKEHLAKDKKKWTDLKHKDAEVRARVIEKKRSGEKLTRQEAAMHYLMFCKRVPV
ncbi:uncharacterized protein K460DRAFT_289945 [Cucurbitaria berberidis CBS 394.84]|uniref:Uncharacterized protein n=1 Tax=Cucurbitaria berberidis CBS 394.84 TaxID=1168544 RepID=A0A9P4GCC6_9PLEO|nr:uncharacterized protein K460DRAFT_289945 [Cucurbitaria berberidis CBS 394.84]KAF1842941.1 hypothetical protein K460DRAFT_289945 [Cucurbitaria berberidis CBS 394.84]